MLEFTICNVYFISRNTVFCNVYGSLQYVFFQMIQSVTPVYSSLFNGIMLWIGILTIKKKKTKVDNFYSTLLLQQSSFMQRLNKYGLIIR